MIKEPPHQFALLNTFFISCHNNYYGQSTNDLQDIAVHFDNDVRERSDITVRDNGRYVSIHYYKSNGSDQEIMLASLIPWWKVEEDYKVTNYVRTNLEHLL